MKYIIKYVNNHDPIAYEIKPKNVRALTDTLFLVKIKKNMTVPAWFQTQNHIFKVKNKKKWYLCEKKSHFSQDFVILEFYTGIDVFKYIEERLSENE